LAETVICSLTFAYSALASQNGNAEAGLFPEREKGSGGLTTAQTDLAHQLANRGSERRGFYER